MGSNNETILSTLIGFSEVPSPLGETGEGERRRLVKAFGSQAPEDRVASFKSKLSARDGVEILEAAAGEDGRN